MLGTSRPLLVVCGGIAAFLLGPLACATAVTNPPGGEGGSGSVTTGTGASGGAGGAGSTSSAGGSGPCMVAADCVAFTDPCNQGACINGECAGIPMNDLVPCDDGKTCSLDDRCMAGECVGGSTKFCPATTSCFVGSCDLATDQCVVVPGNDGAGCIDDDPCTLTGTCNGGVCAPGQLVDCSFLDGTCSVGVCDPQLGCVIQSMNDGTSCDDGLFCTISDTCSGGVCGGAPNPCAPPGDVCLVGSCNENLSMCTSVPGNNGGACNDGNLCSAGETCSNGVCGGGGPANQGVACNDGNSCTTGEICQAGACTGAPIVACQNSDGCCPPGCLLATDDDCQLLDVAVMGGSFYTDDLRAYLATQPFISSAVTHNSCDLATLSQFDVVILYGNMDCFDPAAFNAYTQNGGGLIGTPWLWSNYSGLDALPATGNPGNTQYMVPMNVQVTDPADVLLQGVNFVNGDFIGLEEWTFALKPGATSSVIHNNNASMFAVSKWPYGSGRAVYLNFHYITSDCSLASSYGWGQKLVHNAVLWAGKVL